MQNAYRVVSFWNDSPDIPFQQVEGFYDSEVDARQAIIEEELWKDPAYLRCEIFKDF
jgi:hypothetical protein